MVFAARNAQLLPPGDDWWRFLYCAGRGSGKTWAGSSSIHAAVRAGLGRIHAIAASAADVWDVLVDGPSGTMKTCGARPIPQIIRYKRQLQWPNGATCTFFSSEEARPAPRPPVQLLLHRRAGEDAIRAGGLRPGAHGTPAWRAAAHGHHRHASPEPVHEGADRHAWRVDHQGLDFLTRIRDAYQGSRQWLREIQGEMILEPEDALFKSE
jgi:phage terminase large subunit-like protein